MHARAGRHSPRGTPRRRPRRRDDRGTDRGLYLRAAAPGNGLGKDTLTMARHFHRSDSVRHDGRHVPLLSVLVPVYNEARTIATRLDRVRAVPIPKENIVVDDGSTDGPRAAIDAYRATMPDTPDNRLVVEYCARNRGKGAAVRSAIAHVTGEIALIQDADLEY